MKISKQTKIVGTITAVAIAAVLTFAKPVFAVFPPRALRFVLFSQYYQASSMEAIKTIRLTYSDSARRNAESTFEKGEKVYVSVKIYEPGSQSKIKITDRIFNFKSGSIGNFKFNGADIDGATSIDEGENQLSASIELKNGANYFDYEYETAD